ncbi:Hsp20/alpha crystallin family protein [Niallia sp. 03133]|uniref:Hsp20/alpha crystallin family protein n=1 Tax=Niallia sp. 03133 TaxID=3458060 RepID=UPI004044C3FA
MMGFDNLKKIYQFSEHHSENNYWIDLFQQHTTNPINLAGHSSITSNTPFPACDAFIKNNILFIELELPGIDIHTISIEVEENNTLVINGAFISLQENVSYFLKERQNRHFKKKIATPFSIKETEMKSHFKNGLLIIQFPFLNKADIQKY